MRLVCLVLSCLALSAAHHDDEVAEVISQIQQYLGDPMSVLKSMVTQHVLTEEGTFQVKAIGMMTVMEPHICPVDTKDCSPEENWVFGCSCRKSFRSLAGDCRSKPCELFRHFRDNGADSLGRFVRAQTYEEMYEIFADFIGIPVSRALCECPGMIGASINCVRRYDGNLFQMAQVDRTGFDSLVSHMDWKTIKNVLLGFVKAGCGEKNGKDCVVELSKMYTAMGSFVDNTMRGEDVCHSMVRFGAEYEQLMQTMASFDLETESVKKFLNRLVNAYLEMEQKAMCEPRCAGEMRDSFYSCCTKHSWEVLTSKAMKKGYKDLVRNLWALFSEEKVPNLTNVMNKYLSIFDVESFCGDQTDVYRVKNEQCDAMEA